MKVSKKHVGTKRKIREEKERERRMSMALTAGILIVLISVSGFIINYITSQPSTNQPLSTVHELRAAIVDQLSLTFPNQTFIETATNTLRQAGYKVDYYPGEDVTVEFYRNLPTHGYGLIILRVHSTALVSLFTSEEYSKSKYVYEQLTNKIRNVAYSPEEYAASGISYFGVTNLFVQTSMKGKFVNTTIVMMGCDGLSNTDLAEAFVEKGARAYVGWNQSISASLTDQATTCLLQHLVARQESMKNAVNNTMKEVSADPACESLLTYYPPEAGEQTIGLQW
jgi:hypothetical protein